MDRICQLHWSCLVWKLRHFLIALGFEGSRTDTYLFIFQKAQYILYILEYVNNIIITVNTIDGVRCFITAFSKQFAVKNLGYLGYFLDFEMIKDLNKLWLSQCQYIANLFREWTCWGQHSKCFWISINGSSFAIWLVDLTGYYIHCQ